MKKFLTVVFGLSLLFAGCGNDADFVAPAFLHMDGFKVLKSDISNDTGFYRSNIVAAYVVAYYPDRMSVDTLGVFDVPFTAPVLFNGEAKRLLVYPGIRQGGINATVIPYPFYYHLDTTGVVFTAGDTVDLGTIDLRYCIDTAMFWQGFEFPAEASLQFDTTVKWVQNDATEACTGRGYGRVPFKASEGVVEFGITKTLVDNNSNHSIYLEMDIRNDARMEIYMHAPTMEGGQWERKSVMVCYPSEEWRHMYINLGKTWSQFTYSSTFMISFAALNSEGIDGEMRIDNVKIVNVL